MEGGIEGAHFIWANNYYIVSLYLQCAAELVWPFIFHDQAMKLSSLDIAMAL
jgi:hypothetical protein